MFSTTSLTCGFLFDLDGTLVYTDNLHQSLWKTILTSYGYDLTDKLYHERITGRSDKTIWEEWNIGTETEREQWTLWKEAEFVKRIRETIPIPGGKERIQQWSKLDAWIGVVTNSNQTIACALLEHLEITNYVSFLVTSDSKCKPKPSPEPYDCGMDMLGLDPSTTVIFEDSDVGIQSVCNMKSCPHFVYRLLPSNGHPLSYPNEESIRYVSIKNYLDPQLDAFLGPLVQ
jgi:HAD superfamily hydrolase (TIGR01509 family)